MPAPCDRQLATTSTLLGALVLFLLGSSGCAVLDRGESTPPLPAPPARLLNPVDYPAVTATHAAMGTPIEVQILTEADRANAARAAIATAFAEIDRVEAKMTDWHESSELAAINRAAGQPPVRVSPELLELIAAALELTEVTRGKFDITFAGAGRLWGYPHDAPRRPTDAEIREAMARVSAELVEVDRDRGTVRLPKAGMRMGLGGIAKGYAVDRAVAVITDAGFENFAVNAGGDLTVRGRRGDDLWWVGVREPRDRDAVLAVIPVSNVSVATSGDYERFFEIDGERYSHIVDPETGYPVSGCQSVSIVAPKAFLADALATGVFVLGPVEGMELIEELANVEGVIVDRDGGVAVSSGLTTFSEAP